MPLIIKVKPEHIVTDYPDIKSPDGLISPPPAETFLLTEESPLLKEKLRAKHRQFRKEVARKIRRKLEMKRGPVLSLILIEVFERFAYYGILINFALFLNKCCGWPMFMSAAGVMAFSCVAWFMCALGGFMADSRFGRYNTIVSGFVVYFFGCLMLVVSAFLMGYLYDEKGEAPYELDEPWLLIVLFIALLSVAAGEGAVKANLSAFVADQLKRDAPCQSSKTLFNCFYWMSNVISLLCLAGLTYIQQMRWSYGFTVGFGISALSLTIACMAFLCCRKHFTISGPCGTGVRNMWLIVRQAWSRRGAHTVDTTELLPKSACTSGSQMSLTENDWLNKATVSFGGTFLESEVNEVRSIWKVFLFSSLMVPYWMIYTQLYSTFILQGLHLKAEYGSIIIPAAWPVLCEIVILLILVPVMERGIYPGLAKCGITVPMLWRIMLGMLLATGSAGMAGLVDKKMTSHFFAEGFVNHTTSGERYPVVKEYSIWWQIPQYTLMGMSEVFTSIPGLQMVFSMCPNTPQSVPSAIYNLMISGGSLFSLGVFALSTYRWGWYPRPGEKESTYYLGNDKVAYFFWLLAAIMVVAMFWTLLIGCSCEIGLNRTEIKHQLLVNTESPGKETFKLNGNGKDTDARTSEFVELS